MAYDLFNKALPAALAPAKALCIHHLHYYRWAARGSALKNHGNSPVSQTAARRLTTTVDDWKNPALAGDRVSFFLYLL
jgi:hypothetical protein